MSTNRRVTAVTSLHAGYYWVNGTVDGAPECCELDLSDEQEKALLDYTRALVLKESGFRERYPFWSLGKIPAFPVHISFRIEGAFGGEGIATGESLENNVRTAVERALTFRDVVMGAKEPQESSEIDSNVYVVDWFDDFGAPVTESPPVDRVPFPPQFPQQLGIELTFFANPCHLHHRDMETLRAEIEIGVHGLAIQHKGRVTLFSNSKPLIHNYRLPRLLQRLSESLGAVSDAYRDPHYEVIRFDTTHLVQISPQNSYIRCYRGDRLISVEEVSRVTIGKFCDNSGRWLLNNIRDDGRLEYKYIPGRGEYSSANNMIRQWMATHALAELSTLPGHEEYADAWRKNVYYNLDHYFVRQKKIGYIFYDGKAKLGAAACALLALLTSPDHKRFTDIVELLKQLLLHLSQPDGSFRTFLIPADRNDNQNFYSGEALLSLAKVLAEEWDDTLASRIRRGREYYMPFHRAHGRNTAFIPWHTMAYWHMYKLTGEEEYRRSILELNDWLICIQNLDPRSPPDFLGRFYMQEFAYNGPPHASSTAIYVEGLAYAYDVAKLESDDGRTQAYLNAIRNGLRSLFQLQFRNENGFYLRHKNRSLGGLRTTVTDNQLRCDNTQHAVMAALAVLKFVNDVELKHPCELADEFRQSCWERYSSDVKSATSRRSD